MGFIALLGIAVLNGVVMVSYFNQLHAEGMSIDLVVRDVGRNQIDHRRIVDAIRLAPGPDEGERDEAHRLAFHHRVNVGPDLLVLAVLVLGHQDGLPIRLHLALRHLPD